MRTPFRRERAIGTHPQRFAIYATWQDSLRDWCERINERYIRERGLDTVEKAIPVYAPASDGNLPQSYIDFVTEHVADWIAEDSSRPPDNTSPADTAALRDELLKATFAAGGAAYRPETAMHQFVLSEARAGRPLGAPLGEMQRVMINGQEYVVQVFALDTLYAPAQRLGEARRLSGLIGEA